MITISELADILNRKEGMVIRMMRNRGYLKKNDDPKKWCVDEGYMRADGMITKKGERTLIEDLGIKESHEDEYDDEDEEEDFSDEYDDDDEWKPGFKVFRTISNGEEFCKTYIDGNDDVYTEEEKLIGNVNDDDFEGKFEMYEEGWLEVHWTKKDWEDWNPDGDYV